MRKGVTCDTTQSQGGLQKILKVDISDFEEINRAKPHVSIESQMGKSAALSVKPQACE